MTTINSVGLGLSGATGTGNFVGATSPTLVTPTLGSATMTQITWSDTTKGIIGTAAGDNAGAGFVGQFVTSVISSGSAISLTNNTIANVTSISLTAGDWDVWGNVTYLGNTGTVTYFDGWVSSTSASQPDASLFAQIGYSSTGNNNGMCVPQIRFNLGSTTTIYLSVVAGFNMALTACGGIYARRVR